MDDNFFIYKFQSNLGPEHASYFERYAQNHDLFDADGKIKYSLSSAMQHFRNTVKNLSAKSISGLETATTGLLSHFYASYPPLNSREQAHPVYYKHSAPNRRIVEVKWCNFCQRTNHYENGCHKKFPELLAKHCSAQGSRNQSSTHSSSSQGSRSSAKRRRPNPNLSTPDNNSEPVSFLAMLPIFDSCYMALGNAVNLLTEAWVCDSANSRHICHNRKFFTTLGPLQNQSPIQGLAGTITPQGVGQVGLRCSNETGGFETLHLKNVLYMPEVGVNLISQRQIHRERLHQLSIIDDGICIGSKGIFARLIENNLYIMDVAGPSGFAFPSINEDTLKTWHARLGHLGRQNIIRYAKRMANGIDLTKPLPHSACEPCSFGYLQAEDHRDQKEPGLEPQDLVHSDVTGPFIEGLYGATHFVTFLFDATKNSEVVLWTKKSGVLPAFKGYCLHHEKKDNRF